MVSIFCSIFDGFLFSVVYLMVSFFCGIFDGFLFLWYIWWFLLLCSRAVPCDFGHPLVAPDNRKHVSWAIFSRSFHICDYFSHILLLFLHLMRSLRVFAMHRWLFIQNLVSKTGAGGHHPAKTTTYVASINQSMHRYLENNGFEPWLFIKISCKQSFQHSMCDGLSWIKVAQQFSTLDIYRFWGS